MFLIFKKRENICLIESSRDQILHVCLFYCFTQAQKLVAVADEDIPVIKPISAGV